MTASSCAGGGARRWASPPRSPSPSRSPSSLPSSGPRSPRPPPPSRSPPSAPPSPPPSSTLPLPTTTIVPLPVAAATGSPAPLAPAATRSAILRSGSHRPNATFLPDATAAKADHAEPSPRTDQKPDEKEAEPDLESEPEEEQEQEKEAELPMPEDSGDGKAPEEEGDKAPELEVDELSEGDWYGVEAEEGQKKAPKKKKQLPSLFRSAAQYHWKHCSAKSGHYYIPCVDFDGDGSQRHHERSCSRSPVTCLVSLPKEYKPPAPWPERKEKVWYGNVGDCQVMLRVTAG